MAARILVIDADQVSQRTTAHILRNEGYEVLTGATAAAAVKVLGTEALDLAVIAIDPSAEEIRDAAERIRKAKPGKPVPILAIGGAVDLDERVRILRAGIKDYLSRPFHPAELLARVKAILVRFAPGDGAASRPEGRVVAFYGARGGAGTTSLAINTAIALRRQFARRVAVVDARLQFGDLRVLLDLGLQHKTIVDVVTASAIDMDLLASVLVSHESGIDVLLSPPTPESAELVGLDHLPNILRNLRTAYDFVLVDTDPRLDEATLRVFDSARTVVVVMTADLPSIKNVRLLLGTVESLGYDREKLQLILNRSGAMTGINVRSVEAALDRPIGHHIVNDYRTAMTAVNRGAPFMFDTPDAPLSRSVMDFARAIDGAARPAGAAAPAEARPALTPQGQRVRQ